MIVTKAVSSDLKAIAKIHGRSRQHSMPWLPILHTQEEDLWFFETIVFANDTVLIARVGTEAIGFITFKDDWLNHLYVHPEYWRQGVGASLLERAKASSNRLQLWTFQQNQAARLFYAAHGFDECEFTDGQNCEEKLPDVRMEWNSAR